MASEASYVYILSGQMPKMVHFDEFFSNLKSKSVTRTKNHHKYNFFCLKIFVAGIYKLDLVFFKL